MQGLYESPIVPVEGAAAGRQLWASRYNGPANNSDVATSVGVSPGGTTVFVTGYSERRALRYFYFATIAYGAVHGRQLWASRYKPAGRYGRPCGFRLGITTDFKSRWFADKPAAWR